MKRFYSKFLQKKFIYTYSLLGSACFTTMVNATPLLCEDAVGSKKSTGERLSENETAPHEHVADHGMDADVVEIFQSDFKNRVLEIVLGEAGQRQNALINSHYSKVNPTRIEVLTAQGMSEGRFNRRRQVITEAILVLTDAVDPNLLGRATPEVVRSGKTRLEVEIPIHPAWISGENLEKNLVLLQGLVRSGFIGDKAVHPHIVKDERTQERTPSLIQKSNLALKTAELIEASKDDLSLTPGSEQYPTRPIRVANQAPGGGGKTFTAARFLRDHAFYTSKSQGVKQYQPDVVFIVVNDRDILKDASKTFKPEFKWQESDVAHLYGDAKIPLKLVNAAMKDRLANKKLVLITRRTFALNLDEIIDWIKDRRVALVVDEAQHVNDGTQEFPMIIDRLNALTQDPDDPKHLLLMMSATMYNGGNLITDPRYLGYRDQAKAGRGKIVGPYLETRHDLPLAQRPPDLEQLQRGENVPAIAIYQYNQAAVRGYGKSNREIKDLAPRDAKGDRVLARMAVNPETGNQEVQINRANLLDMWERIKAARKKHEVQRGLIKVNRTAIADAIRDALRDLHRQDVEAGGNDDAEFEALHSTSGNDDNALAFIRDLSESSHRYLIVVDKVNEGIDITGLNLIVIYANVGDSEGGLRLVYQIAVRAGRPSPFATSTTILDWSGIAKKLTGNFNRLQRSANNQGGRSGPTAPIDVVLVNEDLNIEEEVVPVLDKMVVATPVRGRLNEAHTWLLKHNPFIAKTNDESEGLANAILRTIRMLPLVDHSNGSFNFKLRDEHAFAGVGDDDVRHLLTVQGKSMVANYNDLLNYYLEVESIERQLSQPLAATELKELLETQAEYKGIVNDVWQRLSTAMLMFDAHRGSGASIRISAPGRVQLQLPIMGDFYLSTIKRLEKTLGTNAISVRKGPYSDGNEIEITVRGDQAYALLREETGQHRLKLDEDGKAFSQSLFVKVESFPKDEQTFNAGVVSTGYRRIYNGTPKGQEINDKRSGVSARLAHRISSGDSDIEIRDLDAVEKMMLYNRDIYTIDVIQDQIQPHLTDLFEDVSE